jgi:hypothetical protein
MLVLGISPAEAFGCLCAERIAGQRGVAVQCQFPRHPAHMALT